jgi:hypothetical protein
LRDALLSETALRDSPLDVFVQRVQSLANLQAGLNDDTRRFAEARIQSSQPTHSQWLQIVSLAGRQRELASRAGEMALSVDAVSVFQYALEETQGSMLQAAEAVSRREPGEVVGAFQVASLRQLREIVTAVAALPAGISEDGADADRESASESSAQEDSAGEDGARRLAELILIRTIQQRVHAETAALAQAAESQQVPPVTLDDRMARLARTQGRLAELVSGWLGHGAEANTELESLDSEAVGESHEFNP